MEALEGNERREKGNISRPIQDKVFVALPGESKSGKSVLSWTLKNFSSNSTKIVITHVYTTQSNSENRIKSIASSLLSEESNLYRKLERKRTEKHLDDYLYFCTTLKFRAEKLAFEADDVAKGLLELITLHGITTVVMGAAQDKHYTLKMKGLKSKKAVEVMEKADPSCKILFVCKGNLVCTREATTRTSVVSRNPEARSILISCLSQQLKTLSFRKEQNSDNSKVAIAGSSLDPGDRIPRTNCLSGLDLLSELDSSSLYSDNKFETPDTQFELPETQFELGDVKLHDDFDDDDDDVNAKLRQAVQEAKNAKKEAFEEQCKGQRAEKELNLALQRARELEDLYQKEKIRREEIEQALANSDQCVKDVEDKLAAARYLLHSIESEHDQLQQERDNAIRAVQELHEERENMVSSCGSHLEPNTEFSLSELEWATQDFSELFKIGEGGNGWVYKGVVRNTTVAIKLLPSGILCDKSQFKQEVAVLSRVRHPNLVTLLGACYEAPALVYEYLPNGSLEDHLMLLDGTPSLMWQVRTRIIGEICSALISLHSNKPYPVVHGNLKPENILFEANLVSKLSDFGISSLLTRTDPIGTYAYTDPNLLSSGKLRPKSDIYSFGVIILRLLTGKNPLGVVNFVEEALKKGDLGSVIDVSAGDWPYVQAMQLAYLGLRCTELTKWKRPDLVSEVWTVVEPLMKAASLSVSPPFASFLDGNGVPFYFICPIFQEVMKDPHIAADGYTYEAEAIKGWIDSGHNTSPMTNLKLKHCELVPNHPLRSAIQEWFQHRQLQS